MWNNKHSYKMKNVKKDKILNNYNIKRTLFFNEKEAIVVQNNKTWKYNLLINWQFKYENDFPSPDYIV